jgi:outer membrane protein assembly factor BamA
MNQRPPSGNTRLLWILILLLLAQGMAPSASAQEELAEQPTSASVIFPALGYTPDTSVLFGATWLRFFSLEEDPAPGRPSIFSPVLLGTAKKQVMLILGSDLYWDRGRNHVNVVPAFQRFPDQFFGIGRDLAPGAEEDYTPQQFELKLLAERKLVEEFSLGAAFQLVHHRLVETEAGRALASGLVPGTGETLLTGAGLVFSRDTRDFALGPGRGSFLQGRLAFFTPGLGSDFEYTEYMLDLRRYLRLGSAGVLAGQVLATAHVGASPFFTLPQLGGFNGLRGYLGGRYRDQACALARLEWRSRPFWKGLSGAVFAGWGDVAPELQELTTSSQLYAAGFGFRYLINEEQQVKVRMDFGYGHGDGGFYIGLGEAF